MATYYKSTHTVTQEIPYEFKCEHCLEESGALTAVFKAESTRNKMTKSGLKEPEKEHMHQEATESLHKLLQRVHQDAENGTFADEFKDICPHCNKHQSWSLKAMGSLPSIYAFLGVIVGGIFCLAANFIGVIRFTLFYGFIVAVIFGLIGMAIGFICIKIRKAQTQNVREKQIPRIVWPD